MHPLPHGLTSTLLCQAIRGLTASTADNWAAALSAACAKYDISRSLRRTAAFLGHITVESAGLEKLEENLFYVTPSLINKKFKAIRTDEEAAGYARQPALLANKVYANRNGNGGEATGDGWRYRGRGLIHLTGKGNYAAFGKEIGVDFVKDPDLVATPKYAALSAASFWKRKGLNALADAEMYEALSLRINSKLDGFPRREANRKRALDVLCRAILADVTLSAMRGRMGWPF